MQRVRHRDRSTAYRRVDRSEAGPVALFVHGSGGTHAVWAGQLARLRGVGAAVALDLSGHGESDDVEAEAGSDALGSYAADVCAVARETGATVLVGNSLGGAVVLATLLDRDLPVEAAVLAGSGAKLAVADPLRKWLTDDFERAVEFLHGPDRLFHDPDPAAVERSEESMRAVGARVTRRDFLTCHAFDVRDRLGDVDAPLFALTGEYDELTPPRYHEFVADAVRDGEWATVADAAHLSMVERPRAFDDRVAAFLERTS